jgi:hypothetical protein
MVTMAEVINPNLGRQAATQVWKRIASSPCASRLPESDRRWLELFAAVAQRDPGGMSRIGTEILDANRGHRNSVTEYAFGATATGLVCQHRFEDANKLFTMGTKDWLPAGSAPVGMRYLYALANLADPSQWPAGATCNSGAPPS